MKVPNLGHDILEDVAAFDADEALVEALVGEGEFVGVDSELVEDGGMRSSLSSVSMR
jgi:hypothetical protein